MAKDWKGLGRDGSALARKGRPPHALPPLLSLGLELVLELVAARERKRNRRGIYNRAWNI